MATLTRAFVYLVVVSPAMARADDPPPRPGPPAPIAAATLEATIGKGVQYLLRTQNADGSWGSPRWSGGVDVDPVPGSHHSFTAATTAMCVEALLEVGGDGSDVKRAVDKGIEYLLKELPNLRRADPGNLPNVWGHSWGIELLVKLIERLPPGETEKRQLYEKHIKEQLKFLERFETVHGGWFYYAGGMQRPYAPSCSFVNAHILTTLHRAKQLGIELPTKTVERAIQSTQEQRKPDSSFLYSMSSPLEKGGAMHPINRPAGSLGRTQAGLHALRLWGDKDITDTVIKDWLDRLIVRQGWLDMGRKRPIPHESFAAVAGYFYYFGHYYGALNIGFLPTANRPFYQDHLAKILIDRQEPEGSWWDYPLYSYHKPYGTAFALMSLGCCRKALTPKPVRP